jgi:acyl-coenzyme A thioesterase PaaI-like protein
VSGLDSSYARLMGIRLCADAEGREQLLLPFGPHLIGRPGFLHGGAIAGLLSLACDRAIAETLPGDATAVHCVTSTFQFLRAGGEKDVKAAGSVQRSRLISTVQAVAWQETESKPIAIVTRKYRMRSFNFR